jgi:hypothetical protein
MACDTGGEPMSHHEESNATGVGVLSRRTVVRAGAHAAWIVPAISVVTAAPALAASGTSRPTLTITNGSGTWATQNHITGTQYTFTNWAVSGITVTNVSTNPATDVATGITVTISFASSTYKPTTVVSVTGLSANWTLDSTNTTATSYVFNYSGTVAVGSSTTALTPTFNFTTGQGTKPSGETAGTTAAASVSGSPGTTFIPITGSITSTN